MPRTLLRLVVSAFLLGALTPRLASAQFNAAKSKDVGVVFMPFEAAREEDDSLAFLLEDLVGAKGLRALRHPVHTGRNVTVALSGPPSACLAQKECVKLLGGQFNVSLVVAVVVARAGSDVRLATDWYTTGNGLKAHRETLTFPVGKEDTMLLELQRVFDGLFDASLRITPSSLASEGGIISGGDEVDVEALRRSKEKKVSSRREDWGAPADGGSSDRSDPTGDLRGAVEDEPAPSSKSDRSTSSTATVTDDDLADLEDEPAPAAQVREPARERDAPSSSAGSRTGPTSRTEDRSDSRTEEGSASRTADTRRSEAGPKRGGSPDDDEVDLDSLDAGEPAEPDELSLRAGETRGDSVSNYMDAQKHGIGKREYNRLARSGMPFDDYVARRWAYGKRVHLKVAGFYGVGGLTRRYSSTVFIRAGNTLTEEFRWESLGFSGLNPGGIIGFGFAPLDVLEIALDVGLMYGRQDLRREYDGHETGTNIPAVPDSAPTAHVVADLKARFLLLPLRKVKIAPQIGATALFMAGYNIVSEAPLDYTDRPLAVVVGLTVGAGVVVAISPFVGLDIDLTGTFYLTQGVAKHEAYEYFGGVTEPYLDQNKLQPRLKDVPAMGRLTIGPRFLF